MKKELIGAKNSVASILTGVLTFRALTKQKMFDTMLFINMKSSNTFYFFYFTS